MYADDTQLYLSMPNSQLNLTVLQINEDLQSIVHFASRHNLKINAKKSSVMVFGSEELDLSTMNININNIKLPIVEKTRNLGIIMDNSLRFDKHIGSLIQKAVITLKKLYAYKHLLNQQMRTMLCEALVLSIFNFGDPVYNSCLTVTDATRIQRVQNSCLRYIFGIRKFDRVTHTLKVVGWLNMARRRILHANCLYHSIVRTQTPPYLYNKITYRTDVHNINIRFKNTITIPMHKLQSFKRSYSYCIATYYNSVPNDIKSLSSVGFKQKLKKLLFNEQCCTT